MIYFRYNAKTNNIKVMNPYELHTNKDIRTYIKSLPLELVNRTERSAYAEWLAHELLYKLGLFKIHTIDVDITMNESRFRIICYYFISFYYRVVRR